MLAGDYTPLSAVDIFVKDLGLVLDTARASKFPLPLSATAHQMFMQASTAGYAREDDSAVIKIFPGIELPRAKTHERSAERLLGCIADDFTGATDLANNLVRAGMRTVQTIGVPADAAAPADADAVVVALKSRTIAAGRGGGAVARGAALAAGAGRAADLLQVLLDLRLARRRGNIGPVTDALMDALRRATSPSPARPSRRTSARCSRATCSSATCC